MAEQDHGADAIPQRPLGRTGIKVSALGLGGHHLGDLKTIAEAIRLVREAINAGITFFDNCWEYWNGRARGLAGPGPQGQKRVQGCSHDQSLHPRRRGLPTWR